MELRRILYVGCGPSSTERFIGALSDAGVVLRSGPGTTLVECEQGKVELISANDGDAALELLRSHYVNAVLLDLRCTCSDSWSSTIAAGRQLLDALDDTEDVEARYGFHRIIGLVGGPHAEDDATETTLDDFIAELGARGVRHIRRMGSQTDPATFPHRVVCDGLALISTRRKGSRALCSSGGGITGIYFELAALKCLSDALPTGALQSFDMFFGISAGAVVNTLIAMGFGPAEIMAAIAERPGSSSERPDRRLPPIDLSLLKLGHLNLPDFTRRARAAGAASLRQVRTMLRGHVRRGVEDALLEYTALIGPPFRSDQFESLLRELLSTDGASNDFADLEGRLFIGASDQDLRRHMLFGAPPNDDMPISRAVQASLSIHPAFSSVEIDGRWYEDGAVTRTSGFSEAIDRGASLIFVLDPFVPYVSAEAGAANRRGVLYNLDQELRTISFTRFYGTRSWALRTHPDVSSYTFLPSNRLRRLLSMNPMDHRPYLAIWKGAYLSTLRRLEHLAHRLRGDLASHGLSLDLSAPREIGERLRGTENPRFEDFFIDSRVKIEMLPLIMQRRR